MVILFPHLNMVFNSVWLIVKASKIYVGKKIKVIHVSVEDGGNQGKYVIHFLLDHWIGLLFVESEMFELKY